MFDRIAGFYDVMNSVMTAGLHHRWRARAADLAALGAGRQRARRRLRHRRPGDRARAPRRRRAARSSARTSPRRCSSARAAQGARSCAWEWGNALELPYAERALRRRDGRLRRAQLLRPRPRAGRDGARGQARRPRRRARDHDAAQAAAVDLLLGVVRPRRAAHRAPHRRAGGLHLPAELGPALPAARRGSPRRWSAPGCATSAGSSRPVGSSPCMWGRKR